MRLPIIKHIVEFIEENDEDYIIETLEVLESIAQSRGIKHEELIVIGEMMSNMYGALEVKKDIKSGVDKKVALNDFMKRVTF